MKKNPSKNRRRKGEGNGSIHWRTITKKGKEHPQGSILVGFWGKGKEKIFNFYPLPNSELKMQNPSSIATGLLSLEGKRAEKDKIHSQKITRGDSESRSHKTSSCGDFAIFGCCGKL